MDFYDRDGNIITREQWCVLFEQRGEAGDDYHRVGFTEYGMTSVSTVWLGINHRFGGDGPPLIFETMVFTPDDNAQWADYCQRWSTLAQAQAGHAELCSMIFRDVAVDVPDFK